MNMILHIFKKDLYRLRAYILCWIPLLIITSFVYLSKPATGSYLFDLILEFFVPLSFLAQLIYMLIVIPQLMFNDSLNDPSAFWLTRPIPKSSLLLSKLLFAGFFFVILPTVVTSVILTTCEIPGHYIGALIPEYLLNYTTYTLLAMTLASISKNSNQYTSIVLALLFIPYFLERIINSPLSANALNFNIALQDNRWLISIGVQIALFSLLLFYLYQTRNRRRSCGLLIAWVLISLTISNSRPFEIFKNEEGVLSGKKAEKIAMTIDETDDFITYAVGIRRAEDYMELLGSFYYSGLPTNGFGVIQNASYSFETTDQKICESLGGKPAPEEYYHINTLQPMLEPYTIVLDSPRDVYVDKMLRFKEVDAPALGGKFGQYRADALVNFYQYKTFASLPLTAGAAHKEGPVKISILETRPENNECTIVIRSQIVNPRFKRDRTPFFDDRFIFLLCSPNLKECYPPDPYSLRYFYNDKADSIEIKNLSLLFKSPYRSDHSSSAKWLQNATLLILEAQWLGKANKQVADNNFRIGTNGNVPIPNLSARNNLKKLDQIKLPVNPTRDDVQNYISSIRAVSASQNEFNKRDPQVDMLVAIGPEHLDLLIEPPISGPFIYELAAIKSLVRSEHKELILKNLRRIPELSEQVLVFNWEQDAREILLDELKQNKNLPLSWIKAVVKLQDSESYPLLKGHLIQSNDPYDVYEVINGLPGIDLDDAISRVWKKTLRLGGHKRNKIIQVAIRYGQKDALESAIDRLYFGNVHGSWVEKFKETIHVCTGQTGTDRELLEWYRMHENQLIFDPERKVYGIKDPVTGQVSYPSEEKQKLQTEVAGTLSSIRLPENPTRDDIRKYIIKIQEASKGQDGYRGDAAQIKMLAKIDPKHLDILLEMYSYNRLNIYHAISKLAKPDHKELILNNLDRHEFLSTLVVKFGWQDEVKELLIRKLHTHKSLPPSWIDATAGLEGPDTYPALIQFFIHGSQRYRTYLAIKNLPDIELEEAVKKAWHQAKFDSVNTLSLLPIALEYGLIDALDFYATNCDPERVNMSSLWIDRTHQAVCRHTGQFGSYNDFQAWYRTNKDRLHFDAETKMFVVE